MAPSRLGSLATHKALSFLEDSMGLNHAMTNKEARLHPIKSYRGLRSLTFDQHAYTDKEDYRYCAG